MKIKIDVIKKIKLFNFLSIFNFSLNKYNKVNNNRLGVMVIR